MSEHTAENDARLRLLGFADHLCHKACDWYISAKPLGHHLPAWGLIQLWQWHLCNAYERRYDHVIQPT